MAKRPKVMVLKTAGTNCDYETGFAFELAGGEVDSVHINSLIRGECNLMGYQILAIPGGFSYGDDIASGKIVANELKYKLKSKVKTFLNAGNLIIGICNGFQILVKAGLLPDFTSSGEDLDVTLTLNDSAKFEDRWVYLRNQKPETKDQKCIWTRGLPEKIYLPVAHGEGKFTPKNKSILKRLYDENLVVFKYTGESQDKVDYPYNPNGSIDDIAGITDTTGRVLGLMPHPERHIEFTQHPRWTRMEKNGQGDGLKIFQNGVEFAKKNLI